MAFCTKCGQMLPDNATFCAKCGAKMEPFSAQPTPAWTPPAQPYYGGAVHRKTNKSLFIIIGASVLVVALVLVLVFTLGGGTNLSSPEATVNSFVSAVSRNDMKAMIKCTTYGAMIPEQSLDAFIQMQVLSNYSTKEAAMAEAVESFLNQISEDYDSKLDLSLGINSLKATNMYTKYGSNPSSAAVYGMIEVTSKMGQTRTYQMQISVSKSADGKWLIEM